VQAHGERALPRAVEGELFRIVQEALANVARHSQARAVVVRLDYAPAQVTLMVQDDGCGFDARQVLAGVGTRSMRERAESLLGGTFALDSLPGQGTCMVVQCQV